MSYIPKYITKRLIPSDSVKLEGNSIKVKFINVISPINVEGAPNNIKDFIELKIDGELVYSKDKNTLGADVLIEYKGKTFTLDNLKQLGENGIIATGDSLSIVAPNFKNFKVGEKHTIIFSLNLKRGFSFEIERTLQ